MAEITPDVRAWIEQVTGGGVVASRQATAGGREGHTVDVERGGERLPLFLQIAREGDGMGNAFLSMGRQAEVLRALTAAGVPAPKVWGVDSERRLILVDRLAGKTWMHAPATAEEQLSVAQDFIRILAGWHSLDPNQLDLPSFKPVLSVREHQRRVVEEMRAQATAGGQPLEPMLRISLDFLERELPDYDGRPVLCQGDTGPGNFMYENGKVTGVVDWELAHLGDPMDDIAWVTWRTTQHTFTHLPDRLREYAALSGHAIDERRILYYRVNACVRLAANGSGAWGGFGLPGMGEKPQRAAALQPVTSDFDRAADGSAFVFTILHRRMRLEALSDALGLPRPEAGEIEEAPAKDYGDLYEDVLSRLQIAGKRAQDKAAVNLIKGVARSVKYLKEADRNGAKFDAMELEDIGRMLARPQADLTEARKALYAAAVERKVSDEDYVGYHWRRFLRDEVIMRAAAGSVWRRGWAPFR